MAAHTAVSDPVREAPLHVAARSPHSASMLDIEKDIPAAYPPQPTLSGTGTSTASRLPVCEVNSQLSPNGDTDYSQDAPDELEVHGLDGPVERMRRDWDTHMRILELDGMSGLWGQIFTRNIHTIGTSSLGTFGKFPPEIRSMIYKHAMDDFPDEFVVKHELTYDYPIPSLQTEREPNPMEECLQEAENLQPELSTALLSLSIMPSISFTNRQILYESVLIYIQRTRFIMDSYRSLDKLTSFLAQFPNHQGYSAIREIELPNLNDAALGFSQIPFTGLRRLTLGVHAHHMVKLVDGGLRLKSRTELQKDYCGDISKVLLHEELILNFTSQDILSYLELPTDSETYQSLIDILQEGFRERGVRVRVHPVFLESARSVAKVASSTTYDTPSAILSKVYVR